MSKLLVIFVLLLSSYVASSEDMAKRHDRSTFSCNEIRADYVTSGKEVYFVEYQLWCKGSNLYPQEKLSRGDVNPTGEVVYIKEKAK